MCCTSLLNPQVKRWYKKVQQPLDEQISKYEKPFDPSFGKHYSAATCHVRVVISEHKALDAGRTGVRQLLIVGDIDADGYYLPLSWQRF